MTAGALYVYWHFLPSCLEGYLVKDDARLLEESGDKQIGIMISPGRKVAGGSRLNTVILKI